MPYVIGSTPPPLLANGFSIAIFSTLWCLLFIIVLPLAFPINRQQHGRRKGNERERGVRPSWYGTTARSRMSSVRCEIRAGRRSLPRD